LFSEGILDSQGISFTAFISVEAKLHGESRMIQRYFDDNNDDNKR